MTIFHQSINHSALVRHSAARANKQQIALQLACEQAGERAKMRPCGRWWLALGAQERARLCVWCCCSFSLSDRGGEEEFAHRYGRRCAGARRRRPPARSPRRAATPFSLFSSSSYFTCENNSGRCRWPSCTGCPLAGGMPSSLFCCWAAGCSAGVCAVWLPSGRESVISLLFSPLGQINLFTHTQRTYSPSNNVSCY